MAHKAVSDLEKDAVTSARAVLENQNLPAKNNTQLSLLADALIAYGIALARLNKSEAARSTLERAIGVAREADAPDKAGLGALTMIEELEQLSSETLLSAYEQASEGMATIRNRKLQWRVINAAKKVMVRFFGEIDSDRALKMLLARSATSHEDGYEEPLIDQVLTHIDDSLSKATCFLHSNAGAFSLYHQTET